MVLITIDRIAHSHPIYTKPCCQWPGFVDLIQNATSNTKLQLSIVFPHNIYSFSVMYYNSDAFITGHYPDSIYVRFVKKHLDGPEAKVYASAVCIGW